MSESGLTARIIPCLDVAAGRVVKGVRFENLRDQGDPAECALRYARQGADEIVFLDITAAPERRQTDLEWVSRTAAQVFIPLTVGGGVRASDDARQLLLAGADKVAVNTAAVANPGLLNELAERFGSQCVVLSVDARRVPGAAQRVAPGAAQRVAPGAAQRVAPGAAQRVAPGAARHTDGDAGPWWEVVTHGGREGTGLDALVWIRQAVARGAGEILLTSIDSDGTRDGYDLDLLAAVTTSVNVPVIASGGAGTIEHMADALKVGSAAVLAASIFHESTFSVGEVKRRLASLGHAMRLEGAV